MYPEEEDFGFDLAFLSSARRTSSSMARLHSESPGEPSLRDKGRKGRRENLRREPAGKSEYTLEKMYVSRRAGELFAVVFTPSL